MSFPSLSRILILFPWIGMLTLSWRICVRFTLQRDRPTFLMTWPTNLLMSEIMKPCTTCKSTITAKFPMFKTMPNEPMLMLFKQRYLWASFLMFLCVSNNRRHRINKSILALMACVRQYFKNVMKHANCRLNYVVCVHRLPSSQWEYWCMACLRCKHYQVDRAHYGLC